MGISFKQLESYLDNVDLNITIVKSEEKLVVSILPKAKCKDKAVETLKPILLKGTAEELDVEFGTIITKPLDKVAGIVSNIQSFEVDTEEKAKSSAANKAIKEKAKKDKEKAEKKLTKAKEYIESKDYDKAMFVVNEALEIAPKLSSAIHMKDEIEELNKANNQVDMFDVIEEVEKEPTSMKEVGMDEQQEQAYEDQATLAVMNASEGITEPSADDEMEARDMFEAENNGISNQVNFL